jgi:hypothetical protein
MSFLAKKTKQNRVNNHSPLHDFDEIFKAVFPVVDICKKISQQREHEKLLSSHLKK